MPTLFIAPYCKDICRDIGPRGCNIHDFHDSGFSMSIKFVLTHTVNLVKTGLFPSNTVASITV